MLSSADLRLYYLKDMNDNLVESSTMTDVCRVLKTQIWSKTIKSIWTAHFLWIKNEFEIQLNRLKIFCFIFQQCMYLIDILKKFCNTFSTREHHSDSQHTANVRSYKLCTCRSLNIAVVCSSSLKISDNILILSHLAFNLIFQYFNEFYHLLFV